MTSTEYFHGTFWAAASNREEAQEAAFFNLDAGYSDLDVVYVTNLEDTVVYFSRWNKTSPHDIQVILKGEVSTTNFLERSALELQRQASIDIDGIEYNLQDREELFAAMRPKFDGFCIAGNYDGKGDDVALFDADLFNATSAKLLIDGEWTDWLDRETAVEIYLNQCGLQENAPNP